ncbi:MAG: ribonuclease HII [Bacteroidetes bacterium]|nr:MAG: ribonuclease HII [Bacteroidota bacterium]
MAAYLIAGVDEVGRGCLAGPVVAVALILPPDFTHPLLRDSKSLRPAQRTHLAALLWEAALGIGIGMRGPRYIDTHNILQATLAAMQEAIENLPLAPNLVRVDGPHLPVCSYPIQACIRGDAQYPEIAAASIVAKVLRDQLMIRLAAQYPPYQWHKNKGYPTQAHWVAIQKYGPSPLHRYTFLRKGPLLL